MRPQLHLHVSPTSSPLSDFDFQYQSIRKPAAAQLQRPVVSSTNSSHHQQPTTAAGTNQQFDLQLVTKLHKSDKEIAMLKAQVDFYTQSADRTTKIQNDMKALCFEILDKGADLTKKRCDRRNRELYSFKHHHLYSGCCNRVKKRRGLFRNISHNFP